MITIAIDKRYRTIDRLYFAGLGSDNRPIWVTMNPGEPITVTAITENSLGQLVYYHLGVDGEEVPSFLIAQILGMSFDYSYRRSGVSMMDHITKMKSLNLKWRKDPLEFVFTIYDYGPDEKERYVLRIFERSEFVYLRLPAYTQDVYGNPGYERETEGSEEADHRLEEGQVVHVL